MAAAAVSFVAPRPMVGVMRRFSGSAIGLTIARLEGGVHQDLLVYWLVCLQPLVENAIRHGISRNSGPGHLEIRASRVRDRIIIEIEDNGSGVNPIAPSSDGIGLSNTRARLRGLYGARSTLSLRSCAQGTVAAITLPYRAISHSSPDSVDRAVDALA